MILGMVTVQAYSDGKFIVLDEPPTPVLNMPLVLHIEQGSASMTGGAVSERA